MLSNRQVKAADRVGGIELMILWPDALGPEPALDDDCEREATPAERAYAQRLLGEACQRRGLVPVHVRVARVQRPSDPHGSPGEWERSGEYASHLAVVIIGRRWVHASTQRAPTVMFWRPQ